MVERSNVVQAQDVGFVMAELLKEYGLDPEHLVELDWRTVWAVFEGMLVQRNGLSTQRFNPEWLGTKGYFGEPPVFPSIAVQRQRLASNFPGIDLSYVTELPTPPASLQIRAGALLLPKTQICNKRFNPANNPYGEVVTVLGLLAWINPNGTVVEQAVRSLKENSLLKPDTPSLLAELERRTPGDVILLGVDTGYYYSGFPPTYVAAVKKLQSLPLTGTPWRAQFPSLEQVLLTVLLAPELVSPTEGEHDKNVVCCLGTKWRSKQFENKEGHPALQISNTEVSLQLPDDGQLRYNQPHRGTMITWLPPLS